MKTILSLLLLFFTNVLMGQSWDHVIEDLDITEPIKLTGADWNNTLIRNCTIHDTGNGNDGIFLRDVKNVRIENCTIYNIDGQGGIRLSISGNGTDSVSILNNTLYDLEENGISAPQRSQNSTPLNQENLVIEGNIIYNSGLGSSNGLHHAIYCQAADFEIKNNVIFGVRNGNGISVRSSGIVSGNIINGESKSDKPAIRYFSDHFKGESDSLIVENNIIFNDLSSAHTLDIFEFADLYENSISDNHIVKNFNIRFNTIISFQANQFAVRISEDYNQSGYTSILEGNLIINTNDLSQCVSTPSNTVQLYNLLQDKLSNFMSNAQPYDFLLTNNHEAIDHVGNSSSNFPKYDINGDVREENLDAGADEFVGTTGINVIDFTSKNTVFPNPLVLGEPITIESDENIKSLVVFSSNGNVLYNEQLDAKSNTARVDLPLNQSGIYMLRVNSSQPVILLVVEEK